MQTIGTPSNLPALLLLSAIIGCGSHPATVKPPAKPSEPEPTVSQTGPPPAAPVATIPYKVVQKNADGSTVIEITTMREFPESRMREKIGPDGKSTFESITVMTSLPQTQTVVVPAGVEVSTFLAAKPRTLSGEIHFEGPSSSGSGSDGAKVMPPGPVEKPTAGPAPPPPQ